MPNSDPEGQIFLFTPHTNVKILFRAYMYLNFWSLILNIAFALMPGQADMQHY